jgi:hypothetical protein
MLRSEGSETIRLIRKTVDIKFQLEIRRCGKKNFNSADLYAKYYINNRNVLDNKTFK